MSCAFCEMDFGGQWVKNIEPLNPVTPGHRIIIPSEHVEDFTDNPEVTAYVMAYAAKAARKMGHVNLITSCGRLATQSVYHLHVHLVPRVEGDGLHLPWTGQLKQGE